MRIGSEKKLYAADIGFADGKRVPLPHNFRQLNALDPRIQGESITLFNLPGEGFMWGWGRNKKANNMVRANQKLEGVRILYEDKEVVVKIFGTKP